MVGPLEAAGVGEEAGGVGVGSVTGVGGATRIVYV